jgi:hypothetical protein
MRWIKAFGREVCAHKRMTIVIMALLVLFCHRRGPLHRRGPENRCCCLPHDRRRHACRLAHALHGAVLEPCLSGRSLCHVPCDHSLRTRKAARQMRPSESGAHACAECPSQEPHPVLRSVLCALFALTILMVGVSRIYLGVHYASDVVAGFAVSLLWLAFYTKTIVPLFMGAHQGKA